MSDADNTPRPQLPETIPSSFDENPDFFEERRLGKLWRRLKEEPLIPLGCAATCYALYQATKSIRQGDHYQTNKMFRARIYAQGFTLIALVAGSIFYQDERMKRKRFEKALEDKKAAEKRERWLKELELRDKEDREWRERFEGAAQRAREAEEDLKGDVKKTIQSGDQGVKGVVDKTFGNKSVAEQVRWSGWGPGMWISRTADAWRRM